MLFGFFVISTLVAVGYAAYAAGALLGGRASRQPFVAPPAYQPIQPTGTPSAVPSRFARGTESPPIFDYEPATIVDPIAVIAKTARDQHPRSN